MNMRSFDYVSAQSLDDAFAALAARGNGNGHTSHEEIRLLAGGTDLLTLMKADIAAPDRLVDIKRLEDLPAGISEAADGVTLGTLTTLSEIETNSLIRERFPVLAQAASLAATPQLRNMATLGGNLLQRPRCWYFRNALVHCWLKGGDECQAVDGRNQQHALFGGGPCYAVHPSDLAPALVALDATVHLRGPNGERTLPLEEFYALPQDDRRRETIIEPNEIILSIHIPNRPGSHHSVYLKAMDRKVWAFALASVAAVVAVDSGRIAEARIVLGGVAPIPWRATEAEKFLLGKEVTPEQILQAASRALAGAQPLAENGYKVPLAQNLVRRALSEVTQNGGTP